MTKYDIRFCAIGTWIFSDVSSAERCSGNTKNKSVSSLKRFYFFLLFNIL
jgi:hypothetical protein